MLYVINVILIKNYQFLHFLHLRLTGFTLLQEQLNQALAKAILISGSPLSLVEHPLWISFFKEIRPSYTLPTRKRISCTCLDAEFNSVQSEIKEELHNSKNLHLQCDGWSNIRNESIINFVVTTPEPRFVDFIITKENRHDAQYLSEQMKIVMEKYDTEKFFVVIGDNAANMRAAFRVLSETFQHIVPLGCIAHLLHLLCNDILNCDSVKLFLGQVTDIVKTIKKSHLLQALFTRIGKEKNINISLKLAGKTRWGSHLFSLQSLYANKVVLQTLAVSDEILVTTQLKNRLLDDAIFWVRVEKMINILKPIVDLITKLESNDPLIHLVHDEINNIEAKLTELLPESPLQKAEEQKVLKKVSERKQFALGDIHLAATLLNPSSQGCKLNCDELMDAIQFIYNTATNMKLDLPLVKTELTDYRDRTGIWSKRFIWEGVDQISPLLWWRGLRGTNSLADVAVRILSAPVTSAGTERTFSTFSWIHSMKRNKLTTERASKIAYVAHNWKLKHKKPKSIKGSNSKVENISSPTFTPSTSNSTLGKKKNADHPENKKKKKLTAVNLEDEETDTDTDSDSDIDEDISYADSSTGDEDLDEVNED